MIAVCNQLSDHYDISQLHMWVVFPHPFQFVCPFQSCPHSCIPITSFSVGSPRPQPRFSLCLSELATQTFQDQFWIFIWAQNDHAVDASLSPSEQIRSFIDSFWSLTAALLNLLQFHHGLQIVCGAGAGTTFYSGPELESSKTGCLLLERGANLTKLVDVKRKEKLFFHHNCHFCDTYERVWYIFPGANGAFCPEPEPEPPEISLLRIPVQGLYKTGMDARSFAIGRPNQTGRFDKTQEWKYRNKSSALEGTCPNAG